MKNVSIGHSKKGVYHSKNIKSVEGMKEEKKEKKKEIKRNGRGLTKRGLSDAPRALRIQQRKR